MSDVLSERPVSPSTTNEVAGGATKGNDPRSKEDQEAEEKLAERLSILIEAANEKVVPLVKIVRQVRCLSLVLRSSYNLPAP